MAVTIVKAEDLTEEKRTEMEKAGKVGTMVVTEKQRAGRPRALVDSLGFAARG